MFCLQCNLLFNALGIKYFRCSKEGAEKERGPVKAKQVCRTISSRTKPADNSLYWFPAHQSISELELEKVMPVHTIIYL